jgi:hypothetical protein
MEARLMIHEVHIVDGIGMLDPSGDGGEEITKDEAEKLLAALKQMFEDDVKRIQGESNA